jgi:bifunctional non-homologous end joining protein LigD
MSFLGSRAIANRACSALIENEPGAEGASRAISLNSLRCASKITLMATTPRKSSSRAAAVLPREYAPQLPTLVKSPPTGDEWLHEIKYDGYRIGARAERGNVTLISRNGIDWTSTFPEIVAAAKTLPLSQALIDGEAAVLLPNGLTSFQALQGTLKSRSRARLVYFVFDLLYLDGSDLTSTSLEERKGVLARLVGGQPAGTAVIRYSQHFTGDGPGVLREACRRGLEGIVSKKRGLPHESGRSRNWLKTKCVKRQEFVIGGFSDPEGSRSGIGALLVGIHENGELRFAGKVGTGFTSDMLTDLRQRLSRLLSDQCPFSPKPTARLGRNVHWVRPELAAEVAFTEWTSDGKIRHPSFQGLRQDKPASEVTREEPPAIAENRRRQSAT